MKQGAIAEIVYRATVKGALIAFRESDGLSDSNSSVAVSYRYTPDFGALASDTNDGNISGLLMSKFV